MRLFGRLEELVNIVMRTVSGNRATIRPSSDTASTGDAIFELPAKEVGVSELMDTNSSQTVSNKEIDADSTTTQGQFAHGTQIDNPSSNVHGVTGSVVGTTDSQTITNKTISASSNTITGLQHDLHVDNPSSGVHGVSGEIVGTTDTQTIANKTLADQIRATEITTPATPAAGTRLLYPKATGWFQLDSAGTESQLQSSAPPIVTLEGLTDTAISSPEDREVLTYSAGSWTNAQPKQTFLSSTVSTVSTSGLAIVPIGTLSATDIKGDSDVEISLSAAATNSRLFLAHNSGGSFVDGTIFLQRINQDTAVQETVSSIRIQYNDTPQVTIPVSAVSFIDSPPVGNFTYRIAITAGSSQITLTMDGARLLLREI